MRYILYFRWITPNIYRLANDLKKKKSVIFSTITKLLTAKDNTVTRNAHAAKNHCTLQTIKETSSIPANKTIVEAGIITLVTNKSARATLTMNALPEIIKIIKFNDSTLYKQIKPHTTKYKLKIQNTKQTLQLFKSYRIIFASKAIWCVSMFSFDYMTKEIKLKYVVVVFVAV